PPRRAPTIWWWDAPSRALPTLPKRLPPSSRRCARDPYPRARDPDASALRDRHHALRLLHPQVWQQVTLLHRTPRRHLLSRREPRASGLSWSAEVSRWAGDRMAGIPYGGLPLAVSASLAGNLPLIYPRKEEKSYGTKRRIEGIYQAGDRVVLIDDIITDGGSKF